MAEFLGLKNQTLTDKGNDSSVDQSLNGFRNSPGLVRGIQDHFEFGLVDYNDTRFDFVMFHVVCPVLYCLITVVGIAGNTLVIYVILSRNNMRTTTNLLLLNLAMADIAFLLVCPMFTAYIYAVSDWPFGDILCKVMHYFIMVTCYVTIYTLVLISVIRFLTVVCNKKTIWLRTHTNAVLLMAGIWGLMLVANIPILFCYGAQYNRRDGKTECEHYSVAIGRNIYTIMCTLGYVIPLLIIGVLSLSIMIHIRGKRSSLLSQHQESNNRRKKANRLLVSVVVVFALCWLPLHFHLMWAYWGNVPTTKTYIGISLFFNPIAYANSCANPFIYNYFSKDFRESFYQVVCFCSYRQRGETGKELCTLRNGDNTETPKENGCPAKTGQKGETDVTDLEIKALLPSTASNGDLVHMHAPGAIYIGEIKKEDFMVRKPSYDQGNADKN